MVQKRAGWLLAVAGIVVMAAATAACDVNVGDGNFQLGMASGKATDTWTRTYTLSKGGSVEVVNVNGSISVEPSAKDDTVEVRAERTARSSSDEAARELLKKVTIAEDVGPARVHLETRAPKTWGRDGHDVKYFLKVPVGAVVTTRTTNGGLTLRSLSNDVEGSSTNGGITGTDLSGHVDISTTNGGVEVTVTDVAPKGIRLETTNGGVSLELPKTAKATLSARLVNGGIHVSDALPVTKSGENNRRHFEGQLNGGGPRVELSTTNGGIHVGAR